MLNTYDNKPESIWLDRQEALISSLKLQPVVVVVRPKLQDLDGDFAKRPVFPLIESLKNQGVHHVEIAWSKHPGWMSLMKELLQTFSTVSLGAASITDSTGLNCVSQLDLQYAMSPFWDIDLQSEAKKLQQVLVPGVFSPTEVQKAQSFGCRLVKLFPAATLGMAYLNQLKVPFDSFPFIIAAGGLNVEDLNPWLDAGYGAIALGRNLIKHQQLDPKLKEWLKQRANKK